MTLLRQLLIVMFMAFMVLFSSTMVVNVLNAREYVTEQLVAHSRDSAVSLALSIQNGSDDFDPFMIERLLSVPLDRGMFLRTEFRSDRYGTTVRKAGESPEGAGADESSGDIHKAPAWFVDLLQLPSPEAREDVSDGWTIAGQVLVVSNPEAAYDDLWRIARQQFRTFVVVLFIASILLALILRLVLQPLRDVEQQAVSISERDFRILEHVPRTRELQRVVLAMNRMVEKLRTMFNEQVELAERFRAQSLRDPVTGLGNRREFDNRLKAYLGSLQGSGKGTIGFLSIGGFGPYNEEQGHVAGDLLLEQIGQTVVEALRDIPNVAVARNAGSNFNFFLPNTYGEKAEQTVSELFDALENLQVFQDLTNSLVLHMGVAVNSEKRELKLLLSECDMALREAQAGTAHGWVIYRDKDETTQRDKPVRQANEWKDILSTVLADRTLIFHYQPVFSMPDRQIIHHEVLARIELDGEIVSAGGFLPMAERFQLLPMFDRLIVELALEKLELHQGVRLCVNLSPHSLEQDDFLDWLVATCRNRNGVSRLTLEVPEYSVHTRSGQVRELVTRTAGLGIEMSIDHFGVGAATFSYLQSLLVHNVKVDNSFIRDIHKSSDNQFFVKSMVQIAHGQDIEFYAEGVESEEEWDALQELGLDGAMGFGLKRPGPELQG